MATKLAETAKQMGAEAFSQCLGKGTYDILMDDRLSNKLTDLWDCETLENLHAHVAALTTQPLANEQDRQDCIAQRAFLLAAQAYVTISPEVPQESRWPLPGNEI